MYCVVDVNETMMNTTAFISEMAKDHIINLAKFITNINKYIYFFLML